MIRVPREYYPAVMFARKMIRAGTPPPLAFHRAGTYYGVATSDVASWFGRMRGSAPAKSPRAPKRYYWWFVTTACDANPEQYITESGIEHTSNFNTFCRRKSDECEAFSRHNDTGSSYSPYQCLYHSVTGYESGEAADLALKNAKHKHNKEWRIE